jgi:Glycosyl hydrolases family 16
VHAFFLLLATLSAAPQQVFFDDFAYSAREQLTKRGWIVRTVAGWPGVPGATWDAAGVTFENGVMRLTAATDGTVANTRHVQICHERKYGDGTYAARVRFTDDAINGPDGDEVVQTFYTITPLREPLAPEYSEMDFEYLPNGGWGRKGPILFTTTWETFRPEPDWKAVNVHEAKTSSFAGWHTLVIQVADGNVRYFVDGAPFATHSGEFYPESLMSINFNLWFAQNGLAKSTESRRYRQEIDWVFHAGKRVLAPEEVEAIVTKLRKNRVAFRDTVPDAQPPLTSPCNL